MMISDKRQESDEILCKRGRKVKRNFERERIETERDDRKIKKTEEQTEVMKLYMKGLCLKNCRHFLCYTPYYCRKGTKRLK